MRCRSNIEIFVKVCVPIYWVHQGPDPVAGSGGEQGRDEDCSGWHNSKDDTWRAGTKTRDVLNIENLQAHRALTCLFRIQVAMEG